MRSAADDRLDLEICYVIFLVAALLAVPRSCLERRRSTAPGGASPPCRWSADGLLPDRRTSSALFETFGIVDAVTRGGPAGATNILVYKVYRDGFVNLDLGSSAAQSVVLMAVAITFTVLQFRALDRKVNYQV